MVLTAILLSIIIIVTGIIIRWKLEDISYKLDKIIDTVTDYQELLNKLDNIMGRDDWNDVIVNGHSYRREEIEKKASEQLLTNKRNSVGFNWYI